MDKEVVLTDTQKILIIRGFKKLKRKWLILDKADKEQILEGMDISTDKNWLVGLFDELDN